MPVDTSSSDDEPTPYPVTEPTGKEPAKVALLKYAYPLRGIPYRCPGTPSVYLFVVW